MCAANFSLCYTATCYGINECIGSCGCMGDSKYKDSTLHFQAERTQIQWRRPSLGCCFHVGNNIMACRICINRFWLVDDKVIILIGFPLLHMYSWCQSSAKDCTAAMRSTWVAPISPNTLFESWKDTLQKSVQSWYISFALQVWCQIRANEIVHA